jgi:mono/diheme cytochrome c family protein
MRKFFKWIGIILGGGLAMIVLTVAGMYFASEGRLNRVYQIPLETVVIPTNADSIVYGKHIFQFRGCEACHGEKLEGKVYLSDPALGEVNATNLTTGQGGVAVNYKSDSDWVRSIRHGVRPSGKGMLFMPAYEFYFLSEKDLGAVIAYLKSVPPADHDQAVSQLSVTGRVVMTLVKEVVFIPAEIIPHDTPRPVAPEPGHTIAYGEYLTYSCKVCHGPGMSGGKIPAFPEGWPSAANLTTSPDRYQPYFSEDGFVQIIRTGVTRHGRQINPAYMPWSSYKFMTDDELKATWIYLQALPSKEFGNR